MGIRLLGPLELVGPQGRVALGRTKERAVLAMLALHANDSVSEDRLIHALWQDAQPRTAKKTLHTHISRLRRALTEAGGEMVIETGPGGYRLRVGSEGLDVARVEELLAQARAAIDRDDPAWAAVALAEASRAWHGEPLGELADEPWASGEAARLAELRVTVLETRVDAELACGRHATLIAELDALCTSHPLRERLWAQRMVALYRSGRQAEALRVYQDLRGTLAEELGIDPSPDLQALERAVLSQDPSLTWAAPASGAPSPLPTDAVELPVGVVTFLLTDVEGSTRLWEASADAMAEALALHDRIVAEVVGSCGGWVIKSKGEGDSTMSVFLRATDAARAAIDAQRELAAAHWPEDAELRVRVALHTGEAELRDGDYYGGPLNRAARIRELATGGEILCSRAAADLIADRLPPGVALVELGPHQLRDLRRAEHVFALVESSSPGHPNAGDADERDVHDPRASTAGRRRTLGQIPLPPRLETRPWGAFVGRHAHRTAIARALDDTADTGSRLLLLPGAPGIGKSTLVMQAARDAHARGAVVLYGRCDEDLGVPYQAFVDALSQLVGYASERVLAEHLAAFGPVLSRLVPGLARRVADMPQPVTADPDAERYLLYGAVVHLLRAVSRDAPTLLVIDDLHWADRPSLHMLHHLVSTAEPMALVIAGTYRELEIAPDSPLAGALIAWRREVGTEVLPMPGFDEPDIVALLDAATGQELGLPGVELARTLKLDTDGNPFFVTEILRHLTESGAVRQQEDGEWVATRPVDGTTLPDSVRDVIRARVSRLGDKVERMLSVAAVIGVDFGVDPLGRAANIEENDLLDHLDAAVAASFVRERTDSPGRYSFAHALIQQTLYQLLGATRRARIHRAVAEAIEAGPRGPGDTRLIELAHHWAAAGPEHSEKALRCGLDAGYAALASLAPEEGMRHFSRALDLGDDAGFVDPSLRIDLLIGLGTAQRQAGVAAYRETLLGAASEATHLGDAGRLLTAALANTRGHMSASGEVDTARVSVLEGAMAILPEGDSPERAMLLATLCTELTYGAPFQRREALANEAKAIADRLGDASLRVQVHNRIGLAMMVPSTLEQRIGETADTLLLADRLGDPVQQFWANFNRSLAAREAAILPDADDCIGRLAELDARLRQPGLAWFSSYRQAAQALYHGDLVEGERLAIEALQIGNDSGQPDALIAFGAELMLARFMSGQLGELVSMISQFLEDTSELPTYKAVLALAHVQGGNDAEAKALLDEAFVSDFTILPLDYVWLTGMECYAEVAAHLGASEPAARLYEILEPWHGQVADVGGCSFGPVALRLGALASSLGRFDEAAQWFAEAADITERTNAPFFAACTRLGLARMLLARAGPGDAARAGVLLRDSRETAAALGYSAILGHADALLAEHAS